ncbi:2Fe-2S iron-sulfur cluster-binding protein [Acidiferrobacter thiooxydans]|jgi:ferredoxin|uniref:Ferredoxin n=1 Tax=Acidiferrobacter thiooxydans TaxID=163359 RepID=A0A1C2FYA3_9GAMM|nr:2Fe-2S iron-sulfur cluster-binding protein [Acidiferrobacter thiooxydans]MDA8190033.1 2Fe-2S iron-sulfur cluster-binding protein [Gammaproteobacteria bacterium]RCN56770.1 ferredoxin [Acidiferrobacter thiooxydans]UEN99449.1 2Fe-2S iron-sulfur cluster binding domain-containing protein [Acidiferrobacter thiooxydans]
MGSVTFIASPFDVEHVIYVESQRHTTLLSLARELPWPAHKTCGQGLCGACAVKIMFRDRERAMTQVTLSPDEKTLLYRAGKLTDAEYRAAHIPAHPAFWRLACQYVVEDEDILVFA